MLNECSTGIIHLFYSIFSDFLVKKINYLFPYGKSHPSTFYHMQPGSWTAILMAELRDVRLDREESFIILRRRFHLPSTSEVDGRKSRSGGEFWHDLRSDDKHNNQCRILKGYTCDKMTNVIVCNS